MFVLGGGGGEKGRGKSLFALPSSKEVWPAETSSAWLFLFDFSDV